MTSEPKGKRTLRRRKFDEAASRDFAEQLLALAGIPSAIIGRIAVWAWVEDLSEHEMTKDVDYAIPVERVQELAERLGASGLRTYPLDIGGINVEIEERGINVDFVHRDSVLLGDLSPLFREAIAAAGSAGMVLHEGDEPVSTVPIVPLDYLVAMKIATGEPKDEKDAQRLVTKGVEEVDVGHVRVLLHRYGGASAIARFEQVLRDSGHPKAYVRGRYKRSE